MSVPIPLRVDFDAVQLRGLARKTKDGPQTRRLWLLRRFMRWRARGGKIGGVGLQIVRDGCCLSTPGFGRPIDGKSPGKPSRLDDAQRQATGRIVENGPISAVHGVVRWRLIDLAQWIFEEFRIAIAKQTLSRELRTMGYRKLSARPRHHAQARGVDILKNFPACLDRSRARKRWAAAR